MSNGMSPIYREELVTRIKALSPEERSLVIENLPIDEMLHHIMQEFNRMHMREEMLNQVLSRDPYDLLVE